MIILEPFNLTYLDQILILFHDTVHSVNIKDYSQEQVDAWTLRNCFYIFKKTRK